MSYALLDIEQADRVSLEHGIHICVLDAVKVPPHILLLINGEVFTLSTKGVTLNMPIERLLRSISMKQTKTLFVELEAPLLITMDQIQAQVSQLLNVYDRVDVDHATCLTPIKMLFGDVYDKSLVEANFIFELLPKLESLELIATTRHLNLEKELSGSNKFALRTYSKFEINESIIKSRQTKSYA